MENVAWSSRRLESLKAGGVRNAPPCMLGLYLFTYKPYTCMVNCRDGYQISLWPIVSVPFLFDAESTRIAAVAVGAVVHQAEDYTLTSEGAALGGLRTFLDATTR